MPSAISLQRRVLKAFGIRQTPRPQLDQHQSSFLNKLPLEVRRLIYLELWRASGLSQHIIYHKNHSDEEKSHFCHWPCISEFDVEDERQNALQALRDQDPTPQTEESEMVCPEWYPYLSSRWYDHWKCEENMLKAYEAAGVEPISPNVAILQENVCHPSST
ncbi:hypothetical protein F4819DRAFT_492482 [Hypoxylon fuscum]|nr:hypothetical protein F4819DRAFT_492482 [Hypoxylon fuscum]